MTAKQTEIARVMLTGHTLSFRKQSGDAYVLTEYRSGNKVHKGIANAMVLSKVVTYAGGDANWNDYVLSEEATRSLSVH